MHAQVFLADHAQVAEGKLNCLGIGWTTMRGAAPFAVAILVNCTETDQADGGADKPRNWQLALLDAQGFPVTPNDGPPVMLYGEFTMNAGLARVPLAVNFAPLPLPAGRYTFQFTVDGFTLDTWGCSYDVIPAE